MFPLTCWCLLRRPLWVRFPLFSPLLSSMPLLSMERRNGFLLPPCFLGVSCSLFGFLRPRVSQTPLRMCLGALLFLWRLPLFRARPLFRLLPCPVRCRRMMEPFSSMRVPLALPLLPSRRQARLFLSLCPRWWMSLLALCLPRLPARCPAPLPPGRSPFRGRAPRRHRGMPSRMAKTSRRFLPFLSLRPSSVSLFFSPGLSCRRCWITCAALPPCPCRIRPLCPRGNSPFPLPMRRR